MNRGRRSRAPLWMENHRILAGAYRRPIQGQPNEDQLAQALTSMPEGPSSWVVEDLWAPALLARDIAELPPSGEAREAFFRWRFQQAFGADSPWAVQSVRLPEGPWLLSGLPQPTRDSWVALAARLDRPIASLQPRWLWLLNRLAPTLEVPGILLSLSPSADGRLSGTLAAWGRDLCLLRQWEEPMTSAGWNEERIAPSAAYLQRESRTPQAVHIWGAQGEWPSLGIPVYHLDETLLAESEEVA